MPQTTCTTRAEERRALATLALWAFVVGGVLAPVLHLANHRPDHVHGVASHTSAAARTQAQRVWVDHGEQTSEPRAPEQDDGAPEHPLQHGDGSAFHLLMALEDALAWPTGEAALVPAPQLAPVVSVGVRTVDAVWPPVLAQGPPARA